MSPLIWSHGKWWWRGSNVAITNERGFIRLGVEPCKKDGGFTLLELLIIAMIIAIIVAIAIPQLLNARRSAWENRAKLTLRAIGSSELAYQDLTKENTYGTWGALKSTQLIQVGYTRSSIIDNYSIMLWDVDPPSMSFGGLPAYDSRFTIIAIPRSQKNKLRTFGINDDQTLRIYVGKPEDFGNSYGMRNAAFWSPLR